MEVGIILPKLEDDFPSPDIYTTSHTSYEGHKPIIYRLEDCPFQVFFYLNLRPI